MIALLFYFLVLSAPKSLVFVVFLFYRVHTKIGKGKGIAELLLAILCPTIAILFGSLQDGRAFGGTKFEFFIHSATVDGDIWPWILVVLLIVEVVCIVRTACMFAREKK